MNVSTEDLGKHLIAMLDVIQGQGSQAKAHQLKTMVDISHRIVIRVRGARRLGYDRDIALALWKAISILYAEDVAKVGVLTTTMIYKASQWGDCPSLGVLYKETYFGYGNGGVEALRRTLGIKTREELRESLGRLTKFSHKLRIVRAS